MYTIYRARRILTMNPSRPEATHVAVKDDRILGAGSLEELVGWGEHALDERFSDKVLTPGFVEGHSHLLEGTFWRYVYCGYFDRTDPSGKTWAGVTSIEALVERLCAADVALGPSKQPIAGWALDPGFFGGTRVRRQELDRASATRAIGVLHASCHILNVNTKALELAGLLRKGIDHPGIPLGDDGLPTGELKGPEAMALLGPHVGFERDLLACDERGVRDFARLCVRAGVTTAADLANLLPEDAVEMMLRVIGEPDYPVRIVSLLRMQDLHGSALIERALELRKLSTDRLRLGTVKIIADGSVPGFTARLRWPGYYNGVPNGLWYHTPEQLREAYLLALRRGVQIHTHTNGDEATDLALDLMEEALQAHPVPDHRFTLQHCQLADAAQFRRMKALGLCVNLFPNVIYYWGNQYYATTIGPERAMRISACGTALATGVPMAIHSDAPVTPLGPLFTAWCATNRRTANGRVLGIHERIGIADALRTITLGAAYTFKLDGEVGSIECGKRADFAVLEDDPLEVGPERLKDVRIWGTVQGGRIFPAAQA